MKKLGLAAITFIINHSKAVKYFAKQCKYLTIMTVKNFLSKKMPFLNRSAANIKFTYNFFKHYSVIKKCIDAIPRQKNDKKIQVVFNLVRPYAISILFFESILAAKIREYGADVVVLLDDGILKSNDTFIYPKSIKQRDIDIRRRIALAFLSKSPLYMKYSQLIGKDELNNIRAISEEMIKYNSYLYSNLDLKPYVDASVVRYFRSAVGFVENEPEYKNILMLSTENAIISAKVAEKTELILDPRVIVTSHGIYSTWGPFYKYFKRKNIMVTTYGSANYKFGAFVFSKKGLVSNGCDDGFFNKSKKQIDFEKANKAVNSFLNDRFIGISADLSRFGPSHENRTMINEILGRAEHRKIFALFPNVLWDNCITGADTIFKSRSEWLIETVKYFEKAKDKFLIIRAHPSEVSQMRARLGVKEVIERWFRKPITDFGNIFFIPSNNPLKSYSLFPLIDAAIVYRGTIGLEIMYKGIPLLIACNAPYSKKGFTYDLKSQEEYFLSFERIEVILKLQQNSRNGLIRYLFFHFILREMPISFFSEKVPLKPNLKISTEEILNDKNLRHIAETILDKHNFFQG